MLRSAQTSTTSAVCQSGDKLQAKKKVTTSVPASWKLTQQQQAFIDAFAEQPEKKENNRD